MSVSPFNHNHDLRFGMTSPAVAVDQSSTTKQTHFKSVSDELFAQLSGLDDERGGIPDYYLNRVLSLLHNPNFNPAELSFQSSSDIYTSHRSHRHDKAVAAYKQGYPSDSTLPHLIFDLIIDLLRNILISEWRTDLEGPGSHHFVLARQRMPFIEVHQMLQSICMVHSSWVFSCRRVLGVCAATKSRGELFSDTIKNPCFGDWTRYASFCVYKDTSYDHLDVLLAHLHNLEFLELYSPSTSHCAFFSPALLLALGASPLSRLRVLAVQYESRELEGVVDFCKGLSQIHFPALEMVMLCCLHLTRPPSTGVEGTGIPEEVKALSSLPCLRSAPNLATVLTSSSINNPDDTPPHTIKRGDRRLFSIIVPEAARLIWRLRCERVIDRENEQFTQLEIHNRWKAILNRRLTIERHATASKYGRCALPKDRVKETWEGLLENERDLPVDWLEATGVLVGIETDPPTQ